MLLPILFPSNSVDYLQDCPVRFYFMHQFRCPLKFALYIHPKICCYFQDTPAFQQYTNQPLIQIRIIISKSIFSQMTSDRESQPFFFQRKISMNNLFISSCIKTDPFIQSAYKYCVERMNYLALAFIFIGSRKVLIGNP